MFLCPKIKTTFPTRNQNAFSTQKHAMIHKGTLSFFVCFNLRMKKTVPNDSRHGRYLRIACCSQRGFRFFGFGSKRRRIIQRRLEPYFQGAFRWDILVEANSNLEKGPIVLDVSLRNLSPWNLGVSKL